MSGALQAVFMNQRSFAPPPPTVIGQAFGGGFYAGQIGVSGVATHYLIVGPIASAHNTSKQWQTSGTSTSGTSSVIDGPTNSANMNDASHPAAQFCKAVTSGGYTDWYLPAKNELEVCYYNLKPTTNTNSTSSGINANAIPPRASNYTSGGAPAQTSATNFRDTGVEDFVTDDYFTSTESSASYAWRQSFAEGFQGATYKTFNKYVRAVRRVAV